MAAPRSRCALKGSRSAKEPQPLQPSESPADRSSAATVVARGHPRPRFTQVCVRAAIGASSDSGQGSHERRHVPVRAPPCAAGSSSQGGRVLGFVRRRRPIGLAERGLDRSGGEHNRRCGSGRPRCDPDRSGLGKRPALEARLILRKAPVSGWNGGRGGAVCTS